jgi:hypothetical protein
MLGLPTVPAKTITEQLEEISAQMVKEQNPKTFNALVKEMSQLLAFEGMSQLLAAREAGLSGHVSPKARRGVRARAGSSLRPE